MYINIYIYIRKKKKKREEKKYVVLEAYTLILVHRYTHLYRIDVCLTELPGKRKKKEDLSTENY